MALQYEILQDGTALLLTAEGGGTVVSVDSLLPDENKNVATKIFLTKAELDEFENPVGSGLYPSLANLRAIITDEEPDPEIEISIPIAGEATATENGNPAGIVTLAADNDTTSRDLAATPAGVASQVTNALSGSVATRLINTTDPLTGGGDLSTDRTLAINDASIMTKGAVQLATAAEATAGTLATKAVTPAGLKTVADTKVTKAGDTMTGTLYVGASGTNRSSMTISGQIAGNELYVYKPNLADDSHYAAISFRTTRQDGTTNTKKTHIISYSEKSASAAGTSDDPSFVIEGKGMLLAGSGESATAMRNVLVTGVTEVPTSLQRVWPTVGPYNDASEQTIISSDNIIHLISGCNTVANANGAYLDASGNWFPHKAEGQYLGNAGARWDAYIRNLNVSGTVTGVATAASLDTTNTNITNLTTRVATSESTITSQGTRITALESPVSTVTALGAISTLTISSTTASHVRATPGATLAVTVAALAVTSEKLTTLVVQPTAACTLSFVGTVNWTNTSLTSIASGSVAVINIWQIGGIVLLSRVYPTE